jgi:hypothetical protein
LIRRERVRLFLDSNVLTAGMVSTWGLEQAVSRSVSRRGGGPPANPAERARNRGGQPRTGRLFPFDRAYEAGGCALSAERGSGGRAASDSSRGRCSGAAVRHGEPPSPRPLRSGLACGSPRRSSSSARWRWPSPALSPPAPALRRHRHKPLPG